MSDETGVIIPPGVRGIDDPAPTDGQPAQVLIDNRTDLPAEMVQTAVKEFMVENASLAWGRQSTFQTYANEGGSLLARTKFTVPSTIFEEIKLARSIAETDDDVRSTIGAMIATAYSGGMQNFHEDERTVALFNEIAKHANLDHAFKEVYREYLIAQQATTVTVYTRERMQFTPDGTEEQVEERLAAPLVGVLHSEDIRVVNGDLFGNGTLAYVPPHEDLRKWLEEFFGERTTPARKAAMAREDPVAAALFVRPVKVEEERTFLATGVTAYVLNPRMAARFTAPKGANAHPRPLLTANFALIEAKRLLNLMDYALLQGGANFIVVAKKGTDQRPVLHQGELDSLGEAVRKASRTGVIIGDHRIEIDIITPNLSELLNEEKRSLIGRKLANLLVRVPEPTKDGGEEAMKTWVELMTAVITEDRHSVKRHFERSTYEETRKRNTRIFKKGHPKIWHPKIILQGSQFFVDYVLKLRDRGDIPRKFAVEAGGFDWEAGVAQRKREVEAGTDETMAPAAVPFDSNDGPPGDDGGDGRPRGSGPNNGAPRARPGGGPDPAAPRRLTRGPGERVRAWWDEEAGITRRVGEQTLALLEAYPKHQEGRITSFEREALSSGEMAQRGPVTVIPVNQGHDADRFRVVRLAEGLGVVLAYRRQDDALVAKALTFRQPEFDEVAAEELALRLGYTLTEPKEVT